MSSIDAFIKNNLNHKINYHDGLFLKAKDFQVEQNYHQNNRWLQNAVSRSPGIVLGLDLIERNGKLYISAGLALDRIPVAGSSTLFLSREIILPHELNVTHTKLTRDGSYQVELEYQAIKDEDFILHDQSDEEIYTKSLPTIHFDSASNQGSSSAVTRIPIGTVQVSNNRFIITHSPRMISKLDHVGSTFTTISIVNSFKNLVATVTSKNNQVPNSQSVFWLHIQNQLYRNNQLGGVEVDGAAIIGKMIHPKNTLSNSQTPKKKVVTAIDGDLFINGDIYAHTQQGLDKLPQSHLDDINHHFKMGVRKFPQSGGGSSGGQGHAVLPAPKQMKNNKGTLVDPNQIEEGQYESSIPFPEPNGETRNLSQLDRWKSFFKKPQNIGLPFLFNTQRETMRSLNMTTMEADDELVYIEHIDTQTGTFRINTEGVVSLDQSVIKYLFHPGVLPEANAMYVIKRNSDHTAYFERFFYEEEQGLEQYEKVVGVMLPEYEVDAEGVIRFSTSKTPTNFHYIGHKKSISAKLNALLGVRYTNKMSIDVIYGNHGPFLAPIDKNIESYGLLPAVRDIKNTVIWMLDMLQQQTPDVRVPDEYRLDHLVASNH